MSEWNNYSNDHDEYMNANTQDGQDYNQNPNYSPNQEFTTDYQYLPSNEVSSQIETNDGANQAQANSRLNYNVQYQMYPFNQYTYAYMPYSSQQIPDQLNYGYNSWSTQGNETNLQYTCYPWTQVNDSFHNEAVFDLSPTAEEFVPRSQQYKEPAAQTNSEQQQDDSNEQSIYGNEATACHNTARNEPDIDSAEQNSDEARIESDQNQWKDCRRGNVEDDDDLSFYNSSASKVSGPDVRNTGRYYSFLNNWAGSQIAHVLDRNVTDEEQLPNEYSQIKDDTADQIGPQAHSSAMSDENKDPSEPHGNREITQREWLSEQLDEGTLECVVCCEKVKQIDFVWSCDSCYHVIHLRCLRKWAFSSLKDGKWRCPACQSISSIVPMEYRCMCGAVRQPKPQPGVIGAHTCGQNCGRKRPCPHPCVLLCHPGPCPPCEAIVHKSCGCGAETLSVQCSSKLLQACFRTCGKALSCGVHSCARTCHEGPCDDCMEIITQECFCMARAQRCVLCTADFARQQGFSCGETCARILACGAHTCQKRCHLPPCPPCELLPECVRVCPCGQTQIEINQRKLCTDPIPVCDKICAKPFACGPDGDEHFCKSQCHHGECPVCPHKTVLPCNCGHTSREVLCSQLPEMIDNIFCQRKCNKRLSCGRHRCQNTCCTSKHRCLVTCDRMLSCQTHRCVDLCHKGYCAPCLQLGWLEVRCPCGGTTFPPPLPCGMRPPPCSRPCRRARSCGHPPHHACHTGDCPPCVLLTTKRCHGGHEERKTILCSQEDFSCGLPCGKPLDCGKHNCIKSCHKGPCDTEKCKQPCEEKRAWCGHPCDAPCHVGAGGSCPSVAPCRRLVTSMCPCGRREQQRTCADSATDLAMLECDEECCVEMHTRQLTLELQNRNPDVSSRLMPRYSEAVRLMATRNSVFARHVHDELTNLVQLTMKSKHKTCSHSFPSMNRQKRQFIHEMCDQFGCQSEAYDAEPNRNVVAIADKQKSWLPAMSVMEVLDREAHKRRVPPPAAAAAPAAMSPGGRAHLTSANAWASRSSPLPITSESKRPS